MPGRNTSDSGNISLYLHNCQDYSVCARTEFRALNRKSTKKASEDKVNSPYHFQQTLIAEEILQNSPRALKQRVIVAFLGF